MSALINEPKNDDVLWHNVQYRCDIILTKFKSHTDESDDELYSDLMEKPEKTQKVLSLLIYKVLIIFNAAKGDLNRLKKP